MKMMKKKMIEGNITSLTDQNKALKQTSVIWMTSAYAYQLSLDAKN